MKQGIHPRYVDATVTCACGSSWTTRSTRPTLSVDVCSTCHPFYTGEQRIVDTAGQVERFMRRVQNAQAQPRRKKVERREQRIEERRRLEEMRTNEEEVELALADAPNARANTSRATAARLAAAMAGDDIGTPIPDETEATPAAPAATPAPAPAPATEDEQG